jgi:hypothetical protein
MSFRSCTIFGSYQKDLPITLSTTNGAESSRKLYCKTFLHIAQRKTLESVTFGFKDMNIILRLLYFITKKPPNNVRSSWKYWLLFFFFAFLFYRKSSSGRTKNLERKARFKTWRKTTTYCKNKLFIQKLLKIKFYIFYFFYTFCMSIELEIQISFNNEQVKIGFIQIQKIS